MCCLLSSYVVFFSLFVVCAEWHRWRLRMRIGGYEIMKTMETTPETESDQLYSMFWKPRRMTTTPTTDEDELDGDHSYDEL
ncbi:hypothetical protein U9M48_036279 [Paspalum notatum var. saurae]|uniref:Secreted protein n=1 Tax=Paspalum notatum var. saurae TaxID=547442 RepID=A0AAQ3UIV5_PASNO